MSENAVLLSLPENDKLSGVGFLHQVSVKETFQCHTHDFYEFFYVLKGKAIHDINGQKIALSQGTLVFIRPAVCIITALLITMTWKCFLSV